MILSDLANVKYLETKKEKAEALDRLANRGEVYSKLLHIIFDKDIRFFVDTDKIKINHSGIVPFHNEYQLDEMFYNLLHVLGKGELRGNEGIQKCTDYLDKVLAYIGDDKESVELFFGILDNKTRLGIGTTDINKLCKFIKIKQFEVMYAQRWEKAKPDWQKKYCIQPKIDGMRMIVERRSDTKAFSRGGEEINSVNDILNFIQFNCGGSHMMIDGEVENGTLEETGSIRRKKAQVENAVYTIFGIYKLDEWDSGNHTETYESVFEATKKIVSERFSGSSYIRVIPSYEFQANTEDEFHMIIQKYYNEFLESGYEGAVIKTINHVYQPSAGTRRSKDWIKVKPSADSDGIIIGIEEADGEGRGMVGNFKVSWLDIIFDVAPSKMNHDTRTFIFDNKDKFIGKKVEFTYQLLSKYGVPRHAYATKIRED